MTPGPSATARRHRRQNSRPPGQARLSGWVLGLLPVAVGGLVYMMNPEYMGPMFTNPMGVAALVGAAISEVFGMLIIRKIADVKV